MSTRKLEAMSIDELDALQVSLRKQDEEIREQIREIATVRKVKVEANLRELRIKAAQSLGFGDIVVTPETAHLSVKGH